MFIGITRDCPGNNIVYIKGKKLTRFSLISGLGAVQDVNVGYFKIEKMFPSDSETERYFSLLTN